MSTLVNVVIISNNVIEKPSSTVLLKKYLDFSDICNKVRADKLPHYSKYNLAIETEKGKQPLIGLTYDHF